MVTHGRNQMTSTWRKYTICIHVKQLLWNSQSHSYRSWKQQNYINSWHQQITYTRINGLMCVVEPECNKFWFCSQNLMRWHMIDDTGNSCSTSRWTSKSAYSSLKRGRKRLRRSNSVSDLARTNENIYSTKPKHWLQSQNSVQSDSLLTTGYDIDRLLARTSKDSRIMRGLNRNIGELFLISAFPFPNFISQFP